MLKCIYTILYILNMKKYILGRKGRTTLAVSPEVHHLIKLYAREKGISIIEATYLLFRKAFAMEEKLPLE